jgi:hypothetical protein
LFEASEVRIGPAPGEQNAMGIVPEQSSPFRPFTLEPGQQRNVFVFGRFTGCVRYQLGSSTTRRDVAVRYRTLWFHRTAFIKLLEPLTIEAPEYCPEVQPMPYSIGSIENARALTPDARVVLPDQGLWLTNRDSEAWRDCRVTLTLSGGTHTAHLQRVAAKRGALIPRQQFSGDWQVAGALPTHIRVRCSNGAADVDWSARN